MMNAKGEEIGKEVVVKPLSVQDRIAIAQCLNLAVESGAKTEEDLKERTKFFYKIKNELEEEFNSNGNKF